MDLSGRDFICTQDWSQEELVKALDLAAEMKRSGDPHAHCIDEFLEI